MILEKMNAWPTEWYKNDDNVMVRDFIFIDFCHWTWVGKQYAANGTDISKVEKTIAWQMNPNTGNIEQMNVGWICNKALPKDSPVYKELQFTHDCLCHEAEEQARKPQGESNIGHN